MFTAYPPHQFFFQGKPQPAVPIEASDSKYKTELCKKYTQTGTCPYGWKCRFAHGKNEWVSKSKNSNYKKKECISFKKRGFCPYGTRCSFKHDERIISDIPLPFEYISLFILGKYHPREKRLPAFQEISASHQEAEKGEEACINSNSISTISNEEPEIKHYWC